MSQLCTHKKSKHSDYFSLEEESRVEPKKPTKLKKMAQKLNLNTKEKVEIFTAMELTESLGHDDGLTKHQEENETQMDSSDKQRDAHHQGSGSIDIEKQPDYVFNKDTGVASCIHCLEEIKCSKSQRHLVPFFIKKHLETCNPL